MYFSQLKTFNLKTTIIFALSHYSYASFAQKTDSTKAVPYVSGAITITNNGLSLIPTFSLGKPTTVFDFAAGRKRLSFEP